MDNGCVTVFLLVFLSLISESLLIPVDVGACSPKRITCNCGHRDSYKINIYIRQCSRFHRWRLRCGDCKEEPDDDIRCSVYKQCLDCSDQSEECTSCPVGRYGNKCNAECKCPRGVACDQTTGHCLCAGGSCGDPTPKEPTCSTPPAIENGSFIPWSTVYQKGSSISYQCNKGFVIKGTAIVYCSDNEQWIGHLPSCIPEPACPESLPPANGFVTFDPEYKVATYQCSDGYKLVGDTTRTCGPNSDWLGSMPSCEKIVSCQIPPALDDGTITSAKESGKLLLPGDKIQILCHEDYLINGQDTLTCMDNGQWSDKIPECIHQDLICPNPGPLLNGNITVVGSTDSNLRSVYFVGMQLKFCCQPLHFLYGNDSITCTENNTWTGQVPVCIKVITCPAVENLRSGRVDIFTPDPESETSFRTSSLPSNVSSRGVNTLKFRTSVPNLTPQARAATLSVPLPNGHYHVGTRASFVCESRYYDLIGSKVRSCLATGEWSGRPPTCIPVCGRSSVPRVPLITRGNVSAEGQWPWQVGISRRLEENDPLGDWFLMCGGSLVNENWVVTAAHCVTYSQTNIVVPLDEFRFHFGKYYRNDSLDDREVEVRSAQEIHVHPDYEPTSFESDIALVRINPGIRFTSRIQPVCLPNAKDGESDIRLQDGNKGTVIGWGMKEDGSFSDVLQHTEVPVVSAATCQKDYRAQKVPIVITTNMFCAGFSMGEFDSCSGDSGGPLVFPKDSKADRWVLEGIVSWGSPFGCGQEKQYGGYARVQRFIEWMEHFL